MTDQQSTKPEEVSEIPKAIKRIADGIVIDLGLTLIEALKNKEPSVEVTFPLHIKPSLLRELTTNLERIGVFSGTKTKEEREKRLTQGITAFFSDAVTEGILAKGREAVTVLLKRRLKDEKFNRSLDSSI